MGVSLLKRLLQNRVFQVAAILAVTALLLVGIVFVTKGGDGQPPGDGTGTAAATTPPPNPGGTHSTHRPGQRCASGDMGIADRLTGLSPQQRDARLASMKADGVRCVRIDVEWRGSEKREGAYDWSHYDPSVLAITKHGMEPVIIGGYASEWSAEKPDCASVLCAPANTAVGAQQYGNFAGATARHYCNSPYGVQAFEVWNEPNLGKYWPKPNPAHYTDVLMAAYTAIKEACPGTTVLLGGLAKPGSTTDFIEPLEFLEGVYKSGGKGSFDAVSYHAYIPGAPSNWTSSDAWGQMVAMHELMAREGDGNKKIWVTEFAYSSSHVGVAAQADYLEQAVTLFRSYPWAGPFFWYLYQDSNGRTFGLRDERGQPKQALGTYRRLAGV